jgi:chemotaxis protein methyltransferase CheR
MARVAEVVRQRTGLVFPGSRVADVEAAVRRSMARHGVGDPERLVPLLEEDAAARDALVAEVTVGESYFQRDPAQFEFLREHAIPELLSSRPPSSPVRVWSAGCAAGEEPYTVAMLFDVLGALQRAEIVGTDISRPRLADAQRGVYPRWALRSTPDDVRQRYFLPRGRYFELARPIRSRVAFRYLNLAEDEFPSFSTGIWGMDIILCRNVLIYFDEATVERVARRLMATLSDDGWLILGASDPPIGTIAPCNVIMTDGGLVYQRSAPGRRTDLCTRPAEVMARPVADLAGAAGPGEAAAPGEHRGLLAGPEAIDLVAEAAPMPPVWLDVPDFGKNGAQNDEQEPLERGLAEPQRELLDAYRRRDFDEVCRRAEFRSPPLTEAEYVAWLRALANRGRLEEARDVGAQAVVEVGATAELMYLEAVLLLEAGRPQEAAAAARKALYLDRDLAVAHLALANARQREGDRTGARRSLQNAAALLKRMPGEAAVPAADGETARRMAELVNMNLRILNHEG